MGRSGLLVVVPLVVLAVTAGGSGCGNDFDALFPIETGTAGPDGGDSAPPTGAVDSAPAGADATPPDANGPLCAPPVPTCAAEAACGGGACTNTCAGCACTCPRFDCDDGEARSCATTCSGGAQCTVNCDIQGPCALTAHGATSATLTCDEKATSCTLVCDGGGSCEGECKNGGAACALACAAGTACLVRCSGGAASCTVDCQGGGQKRECPNGVFTCNRDCP